MNDATSGPGLDVTLRGFVAGQRVFNRYTLVRTLGRGGMGIVWLARDELLDRDVALKFLPELIIQDRAVLEDLKREAKRSLELTHKNIVRIYDFVHDVISACISMEYVEGDALSNLRADKPSKIFEPDEIKPWLSQLCEALDYAHNHARIIHRDLKPSNLMISKRGQLKVADFGIARSLSDSVSMLTHTLGRSGTLVYMSPQQLDGERGTHFDDIYSLGASIYELLTSKPPFYSGDVSRQIHDRIAPSMMQRRRDLEIEGNVISRSWEETVAMCLAKDPAKRPQSVSEIVNRLQLTSQQPETLQHVALEKAPRKNVLFTAFAAAAICMIAVGTWYFATRPAPEKIVQQPTPRTQPSQPPKQTKRVDVNLPTGQSGELSTLSDYISVSVDKDGHYFFDKDQVNDEELLNRLHKVHESTPEAKVFVRGDRGSVYQNVTHALDIIRSSGFYKISFEIRSESLKGGPTPKGTETMAIVGIGVNLPAAEGPSAGGVKDFVSVRVLEGNAVFFDNQIVADDQVLPRLVQLHRANPDIKISLSATPMAIYGDVIGVLDKIRLAGITKVGYQLRPAPSNGVAKDEVKEVAGGPDSMSISMAKAKGLPLYAPKPEYPFEARNQHITGSGVCVLTVDPKSGNVADAIMAQSTGSPILDNSTLSALKQWRFKPGTVTKVRLPITFTMSGASY